MAETTTDLLKEFEKNKIKIADWCIVISGMCRYIGLPAPTPGSSAWLDRQPAGSPGSLSHPAIRHQNSGTMWLQPLFELNVRTTENSVQIGLSCMEAVIGKNAGALVRYDRVSFICDMDEQAQKGWHKVVVEFYELIDKALEAQRKQSNLIELAPANALSSGGRLPRRN